MPSTARAKSALYSKLARSTSGFTLVELLLSITVLGVLAAITLPQLNGVYERQKLTNAANEMVTAIKTIQNKALANNQDRFAVPLASGGPIFDCTNSLPYVSGYRLDVNPDGGGYTTYFEFKQTSQSGVNCEQGADKIRTTLLPSGVYIDDADLGDKVSYQSVSGKIELSAINTPGQIKLQSTYIDPSVLTYYVCIDQGRAYAKQNDPC